MKLRFLTLLFSLVGVCSFAQPPKNQTDVKGLKQGNWEKYSSEGFKIYEGQFKDGLPVGLFKYYYPKGELKATNNYFGANSIYAAAHIYHTNGKMEATGLYYQQKKDSLWKFYDDEENLISEEFYTKGLKNGNWKHYYPSGKLLRTEYWKNDSKDGKWTLYYETGKLQQEIAYLEGKLEGDFKVYDAEASCIIEGKYKNDNPSGNWFYYENGGRVKYIEQFKAGKLISKKFQNGLDEEPYPNGIPKSKYTYKGGKKNGVFVEYYNAGEFKRRRKPIDPGSLDSANPTEEWEEYLDGQKVKVKGFYKDDKLEGEVNYYKLDGKLEKKEKYLSGVLVK